jgi:hypothetical protein
MDIYSLSRNFFDWSFENPEKIKPLHTAIFFFAIEHCNRLWWKEKFWFPTSMAMEAIWIKKWQSYKDAFDELVEWWFIKEVEKSKNQYSSCIISLWNAYDKKGKAQVKALDKALIKHGQKHGWKQGESTVDIDIQIYNNTNIPNTNIQVDTKNNEYGESIKLLKEIDIDNIQNCVPPDYAVEYKKYWIEFVLYWTEKSRNWKIRAEKEQTFEVKRRFYTWLSRAKVKYDKHKKTFNSIW